MLKRVCTILLLFVALCSEAVAADQSITATVAEPYLELHTGPGRGYPIFQVVKRGQPITILKRRNDWYKVGYQNKIIGWVHVDQLQKTLAPDGGQTRIETLNIGQYQRRRGEVGVMAGAISGNDATTLYGGYAFTRNLSTEFSLAQAVGNYSNNIIYNLKLLHQAFPDWRSSPFFAMGLSNINTTPRATLVRAKDRNDMAANVGLGLRHYLSRSFALRAEYTHYVVFSSDDNNEEIDEWKIGLISFF